MGNHEAGRYMDLVAKTAWRLIEDNVTPIDGIDFLDLLDYICNGQKGCDAEFEINDKDYMFSTDPQGPLGRMIAIAFGDGRDWAKECKLDADRNDDKAWDEWYAGPEKCFNDRYDFH